MKEPSIIVPFHNEEGCVAFVIEEILREFPDAEIVAIDDGSTDRTREILKRFERVRLIAFEQRLGQSAALWAGLRKATREICVLMDGDGESDPRDIRALLKLLDTNDFACGYRIGRQDGAMKRIASAAANRLRKAVTKDSAKDTGAMKAIRRIHAPHLVPFEGMHRFVPALLQGAGLTLGQAPVRARRRYAGKSKYGIWDRARRGLLDLMGVKWIMSRRIDPNKSDE
ncbi:MAG: glycosyltransferase family 2 protein [Candidatus Taylorbacteria bacterium]|nr:glycosyltransferase family 2 protein [Candidatus Taylorbacteria bacterium]